MGLFETKEYPQVAIFYKNIFSLGCQEKSDKVVERRSTVVDLHSGADAGRERIVKRKNSGRNIERTMFLSLCPVYVPLFLPSKKRRQNQNKQGTKKKKKKKKKKKRVRIKGRKTHNRQKVSLQHPR